MAVERQEQPVNPARREFLIGGIYLAVGSALFGHGFGRFVENAVKIPGRRERAEQDVRAAGTYPPKEQDLEEAKKFREYYAAHPLEPRDEQKAQTAKAVIKQNADYKDGVKIRTNHLATEEGHSGVRNGFDIVETIVGAGMGTMGSVDLIKVYDRSKAPTQTEQLHTVPQE